LDPHSVEKKPDAIVDLPLKALTIDLNHVDEVPYHARRVHSVDPNADPIASNIALLTRENRWRLSGLGCKLRASR